MKKTTVTLPPAPCMAGTFEQSVVVHPDLRGSFSFDAISNTNRRARAALAFLVQDGLEGPGSFTLKHETVCQMLDCIEGLLDQQRMLLDAHMENPEGKA